MISFRPPREGIGRVLRRPRRDVLADAVETWEVAPPGSSHVPRGWCLPGQLERVRGSAFGGALEVVRHLIGGFEAPHRGTIGYRFRDVDLVDGVLYSATGARHLRRRRGTLLPCHLRVEFDRAALYESWAGNRWFGNWLTDDCLTYPLATSMPGVPVTTRPATGHVAAYEARLGMAPRRVAGARFDELVLFADREPTQDLRRRGLEVRARLVAGIDVRAHPGVFLVRGSSGERRCLTGEMDLAERLAARRGLVILDPERSSVEEIVAICAGAEVVVGVEGSHLCHGLVAMPRTGAIVVLQPPERVVSVLKSFTDHQGPAYGFVIGSGDARTFAVDAGEVERTLDLVGGLSRIGPI